MLSHSSSVQHSSGTLSLQTCKTSLVTVNSRRTLKHTGHHTSTQQSFAFCHEVFHDEPCTMPNYTHLAQLATLFYAFPSLPSTSFFSSSSSSLNKNNNDQQRVKTDNNKETEVRPRYKKGTKNETIGRGTQKYINKN